MSLTQKTVRGISWSLVERIVSQVVQFGIGIVLARLLSPEEYGLTGMLALFLAIADTFIVTGFGEALMQKKEANRLDYSTVFFTNLGTGVFFYGLFYLLAPAIGRFFGEPQLEGLLLVLGLSTLFNALGATARIPLLLKMDFRSLSLVSVLATAISGVAAITLAYLGYGVWSLVWRTIISSVLTTTLLLALGKPQLQVGFSISAFKEFYRFGSKLLFSRLLDELYLNFFNIIIGKMYNAHELGLYARASGFRDLPSKIMSNAVLTVSYPALLAVKEDQARLKRSYIRLIQGTMYLSFVLMFGMAAAAENFIIGLIGEKWRAAVPYLQLLSFTGIFFTLRYLNLNLLIVVGRSDLYLKLELLIKLLSIPIILVGAFFGIKAMIIGMILASVIDFYFTSSWSGRFIQYSTAAQIRDITPYFLFTIPVSAVVWLVGEIPFFTPFILLILQSIVGFVTTLFLSDLLQLKPYLETKEMVLRKLKPTVASAPENAL
jgi:O-antigen/teichoic acid export membrane protein